ncbi:MAG: response regulator [Chitinophagaceae bacterium]|nr:response regulator [Chitinophagaceae bacterium]
MAEKVINLEHVRYMFIIDDDAVQREMIKDYMAERYLFEVKIYDNGEDAMEEIKTLKPEIIVLDYYLNSHITKSKNGIEVLKQIKQVSPTTEVVMFTGEDKLEVALESMRNGAYDYVVKGESAFNKIEKVINNLGERHRMMAIHIAQKRTITFLSIVIGAIVAVAVILGVMGLL